MKIVVNFECDSAPPEGEPITLFIGAVGYESRSSWLLEQGRLSYQKLLGLRFHYSEELHFSKALRAFEDHGAEVVSFPAGSHWSDLVPHLKKALSSADQSPTVAIDISAMSRDMIAGVLLAVCECQRGSSVRLFAHYTPAEFTKPSDTTGVTIAQPIMAELAGWSSRPDSPVAALVGLGFENGSALGALQYLEPARAWLFEPHGPDERFLREVRKANAFIDSVFDVRPLPYDVAKPVETRAMLGSLMRDLRPTHRIVFVPFGPKMFSWLCILSALEDPTTESAVWRFSAQEERPPVDYQPSGTSIWHSVDVSAQNTE